MTFTNDDVLFIYAVLQGAKQSFEVAKKHYKHNIKFRKECEESIANCEVLLARIGVEINQSIMEVSENE